RPLTGVLKIPVLIVAPFHTSRRGIPTLTEMSRMFLSDADRSFDDADSWFSANFATPLRPLRFKILLVSAGGKPQTAKFAKRAREEREVETSGTLCGLCETFATSAV